MADPAVLEPLYRNGELEKMAHSGVAELIQDPRAFLLKHPITIDEINAMSGVRMAAIKNGKLAKRPGSLMGTLNMHKSEAFELSLLSSDGHAFQAHYVRMDPSNAAINWYTLVGGPDVMLTCKLTGCTFVARQPAGGLLEVAHLQPQGETGDALNARLKAVSGNIPYGRLNYDYVTRQASVVGVRRAGRWEVYAQKVDKEKQVGVRSVHRVFPPE